MEMNTTRTLLFTYLIIQIEFLVSIEFTFETSGSPSLLKASEKKIMELQNLTRRRVSTDHTVVQIQPDPTSSRPVPITTQQVQRRDVGTSTHEQSWSSLIATAIRKMKLVGLKQAFHPDATTLER